MQFNAKKDSFCSQSTKYFVAPAEILTFVANKKIKLSPFSKYKMTEFLEILKYVIPALVVLGASYSTLNKLINNDINKYKIEMVSGNQKLLLPMRMQAYERLTLLLERIQPEAVILRNQNMSLSAKQMQLVVIQDVRKEFEHNLSQQIYVGSASWYALKSAKDSTIQAITVATKNLPNDANSAQFSMNFIALFNEMDENPLALASEILKREVRELFGF